MNRGKENSQVSNPYDDRCKAAKRFSGHGALTGADQGVVAHLAFDRGLSDSEFYRAAHEVIYERAGGAALNALALSGERQHTNLPRSFEEARKMPGASIEEVLKRLDEDRSVNDPDDIEFYRTGVRDHIEGLYAFSDLYRRKFGDGNSTKEQLLASECSMYWIQHNSLQFLREDGKNPDKYPTVRIYLNPRLQDSLEIYKKIFAQATRKKLRFQAKITAPSGYSKLSVDSMVEYYAEESKKKMEVRRDPIVFCGFEESKDELLRIVEEVYGQYESAFEGRKTGAIPLAIAPGLAVGEEPVGESGRESLTRAIGSWPLEQPSMTQRSFGKLLSRGI